MADDKTTKTKLPWGLSEKQLKPNSVQSLPKSTLEAFSIGMTNPSLKKNVFQKSREEKEKKKKKEEEETARVLEEFVTTFEEPSKAKMTFVRGAVINPDKDTTGVAGTLYEPQGVKSNKPDVKPVLLATPPSLPSSSITKPKKDKEGKKKSVLEMFGDELKKIQEERKGRQQKKSNDGGSTLPVEEEEEDVIDPYNTGMIDDKPVTGSGDSMSTNLYIGNINPKMTEEMLCQHFGKFGALASIKIMWPRTEEERSRNRNCGFVAFMRRKDAEKALEAMKGSTILGHEVEIGWGKTVPLPPNPFYVTPEHSEEASTYISDHPPTGFPFNARPNSRKSRSSGRGGSYNNMPPPGSVDEGGRGETEERYEEDNRGRQSFEERLYTSLIKVIIPSDQEILCLIHRMIEFIIREGPMFEAMIMNREMGNKKFRFLFDNQCPEHVYYRWKLFSILQGDSPETWKTDEFRMFEKGSLWRPPPLKNLRGKVLPPIMEIVKRGQLPHQNRNYLEDLLRNVTMTRSKIKEGMIWCMEHAESSDEIVECITESLTLMETPLPLKVARLYLLTDILQNCNAHVSCAARYRRGFEGKLLPVMEHFHDVMIKMDSRIRAESLKKRVLRCLQSWDQMTVYHFNFIDKLREQFIGKTQEEIEKKKAFETVAALMSFGRNDHPSEDVVDTTTSSTVMDDYTPIDFSGGQSTYVVDEDIDGEPLPDPDVDGIPLVDYNEDIDGIPMEDDAPPIFPPIAPPTIAPPKPQPSSAVVRSKWELVDYGQGSSDDEEDMSSSVLREPSKSSLQEVTSNNDKTDNKEEEKRQQLRDVELKVIELTEALESSGSYTQSEIQERTTRFREKLLKDILSGQSSSGAVTDEKKIDSGEGRNRAKARDDSTSPPDRKDRSRSPISRSNKKRHSSPGSSKKRSRSKDKHKRHKSRSRSPRGGKHSRSSPSRHSSSRKDRHRSKSSSPSRRSSSKKSSRK